MNGPILRFATRVGLAALCFVLCRVHSPAAPMLEKSEFIYERAPVPSCHASTVAETRNGLIAAWFGGSDEGEKDVAIWTSQSEGAKWSPPREVATGVSDDGKRYPCWNPVLFQMPNKPLLLFYKVGPSPSTWWGMLIRSDDAGKSWSQPARLPNDMLGPIKNKPVLIGDRLWCGSSTENAGWRIHLEFTPDAGKTWSSTGALNDGKAFGAIQPTILSWGGGRIQLLCRSRQAKIVECWSDDGGRTFSALASTALPNPNSGIDAVKLTDGRALLVYNHTTRGRSPLNVAVSADGKEWSNVLALESEPGEYSYPAVIQSSDGRVHVTYTWKRQRIRHVVLKP